MRCFLALELDEAAREKLSRTQSELKALGISASYPKKEQLHCTLCFFGELSESEAQDKTGKLKTFEAKPFTASLKGLGFFPSAHNARVAWAGFEEGKEAAMELQKKIASTLNYNEGKPFHPHVTLARIKSPANAQKLKEFAERHAETLATFRASTIRFYKSTLSPQGAEYEVLWEKTLGQD